MKTLHKQLVKQPAILAKKLFKLEKRGRYEDAFTEVKEFWNDIDTYPNLEGLSFSEAAEILLRCGAIIGFFGHNKQLLNAQAKSKDLLTDALKRFSEIGETGKIVECGNYLALAYWRTGELNEAEIWLEEAFTHKLPDSHPTRLYSYIIRSLINASIGCYEENFELAETVENDFQSYGDAFLNGSFCTNLGISFIEFGNQQKALQYLELARYYHQISQHKVYLGTVENNLAQLYKLEKRFRQAHLASDNATKIFKQIKDHTREGFSLDTKAQIFLHETKFSEALQTSEKAIKILLKGENKAYLVETMLTKAKTLIRLDEISAATLCLFDAVQIAKVHINEDSANNLVKEFENTLRDKNSVTETSESAADTEEIQINSGQSNAGEELEFVLPREIAHYNDIQVVKIQNTYLESVGLKQDSLAIIVKENVRRGELIAVSEKMTGAISCGFYDADLGFVCLEGFDNEPLLFDETEIEILGKIVGVCEASKASGGKLFVRLLNL